MPRAACCLLLLAAVVITAASSPERALVNSGKPALLIDSPVCCTVYVLCAASCGLGLIPLMQALQPPLPAHPLIQQPFDMCFLNDNSKEEDSWQRLVCHSLSRHAMKDCTPVIAKAWIEM